MNELRAWKNNPRVSHRGYQWPFPSLTIALKQIVYHLSLHGGRSVTIHVESVAPETKKDYRQFQISLNLSIVCNNINNDTSL